MPSRPAIDATRLAPRHDDGHESGDGHDDVLDVTATAKAPPPMARAVSASHGATHDNDHDHDGGHESGHGPHGATQVKRLTPGRRLLNLFHWRLPLAWLGTAIGVAVLTTKAPFAYRDWPLHWSAAPSPYIITRDFTLALTLFALVTLFTAFTVNPAAYRPVSRVLEDVVAFDRWSGRFRSIRADWTSDVLVTLISLTPMLLLLDVKRHGWQAAAIDIMVIGLAVLVNASVSEVVKIASKRQRPLSYHSVPDVRTPRSWFLSFYSSHTANSFATTTALAYTFERQYASSEWHTAVWVAGSLLSMAVGMNRVAAGKHWPSDVFTGALAGSFWGFVIPWLHTKAW